MADRTDPTTFTNLALKTLKTLDEDTTLYAEDSGAVILLNGAITVTLPEASRREGMLFTFIVKDGSKSMDVKPASGDGINGVINDGSDSSALVSYDGTDDDYLASASGSNNAGDRVSLFSDGSGDWWILEGAGVWTQTSP